MRTAFLTARPQPNLATPFSEPPALFGVDDTVPLGQMPAGTAVYLFNLIPSDQGLRLRDGYLEWAIQLQGGEVKSLVPYSGANINDRKLFAVTKVGIFDVTTISQVNPTPVVTFASQSEDAGFVSYLHFTDPSGNQTLLVADSRNGMYEYNPMGSTWTKLTTEITGVDPELVVFLTSHKGRVWLVARDAADAWYLPAGQKYGLASRFQIGPKMRHGGHLVGVYPWTIDGGSGLDDYLLFISKGGDVLAYQGNDPALPAGWNLVGNWFVGEIPTGRRIALETGGDTLILCAYGLISASALLNGVDPSRVERSNAGKVTNRLRRDLRERKGLPNWEIKNLAEEGVFAINVPNRTGEPPIQYVLNVNRTSEGSGGGWAYWRDVPGITFEPYEGNAFFGTKDGRVCRMVGTTDDVKLVSLGGFWDQDNWDQAPWGGPVLYGTPVEFSILGRFTDFGAPAYFKQVQWIRPSFLISNVTSWTAKAVYDFNLTEYVGLPIRPSLDGGVFDVDLWDRAIWAGISPLSRPMGGGGYGRNVAIALRGTSTGGTVLVNIEGTWQPWNYL